MPHNKSTATDRRMIAGIASGLLLLCVAVYGRTLWHDFAAFDDEQYVLLNPFVPSGLTWHGILWAFTSGYASNWHPLTWLSHMLDCQIYGLEPWGHHLTNLLLHTANSIVLFFLLRTLTRTTWRCAVVAALFAAHPLHVESVAWVAERKDLLSTLFWFLTTWAYVSFVREGGFRRYVGVFLLLALGLMCKPMLVTLPFTLLLLDYWPLDRFRPSNKTQSLLAVFLRLCWEKMPLFALSAVSTAITYVVQQKGGAVSSIDSITFGLRVENSLVAYVIYLWKMLCPVKLAIMYPYPLGGHPTWQFTAAAVILAAITVGVLRQRRLRPYLAVGWFWYLGTLVPVIGLVQVGMQAYADRYTYVPLLGPFIMIVWLATEVLGRYK